MAIEHARSEGLTPDVALLDVNEERRLQKTKVKNTLKAVGYGILTLAAGAVSTSVFINAEGTTGTVGMVATALTPVTMGGGLYLSTRAKDKSGEAERILESIKKKEP